MDYENQHILQVDIQKEMKKSYIDYAMSVIVGRALPNVCDGLKPVHRRILYTMFEENITPDRPPLKSAATVGSVLAKYHPHGDAAVYDTMVRLAQDFAMRYPLVDGQGNFGSIDGDPPAAQRYTESRMAKIALELIGDIGKDTVDFQPSYDNRNKEPVVLPARFPNLLVNGAAGIAVGMATNIPPHNLGEVIDGTIHLIDNPDADVQALNAFIKGPDFPGGGQILGRSGIRSAYATGRGSIKMRAKCEIVDWKDGRFKIIVTELPYQVNKARLIESIAELVKEKRIEGISDLRDESDRSGMSIVMELRRDANPQVVLNQLYKNTQLQDNFSANMLALVGERPQPRLLGLKEILEQYIAHQIRVVRRRTAYDIRKAHERAHILEGLLVACDHIDEVIRIIRAQSTVAEAKEALMARFAALEVKNILDLQGIEGIQHHGGGLSEEQAQAIVNMRFGQLTGLERNKISDEFDGLMEKIRNLLEVISTEENVRACIKAELLETKEKYADERRTEILAVDNDIDIEDLIEEQDNVFTLTHFGYIKRLPVSTYRAQRRGGRGITGLTTREEDFAETLFVASTHDYILFFTNKGRLYRLKGYQVPETGRTAKGMNIINLLPLEGEEKVCAMVPVRSFEEGYLVTCTRRGITRRTRLSDLDSVRKAGIRALSIDEGDELVSIQLTDGSGELMIVTKKAQAVRFSEENLRTMGRLARGVHGVRLSEGDEVIGMVAVDENKFVLTVTENGYGKCSPPEDYRSIKRNGKGVTTHALTEKTGLLAGVAMVDSGCDVMLITSDSIIIRLPAQSVRTCGRSSQGVILMRFEDGVTVNSLAVVAREEQEDEDEATDSEE